MSIYGNKIETIEEQVILQEIGIGHFTKKELQDPESINKILKQKDIFRNLNNALSFAIVIMGIIAGVLTSSFFVGLIIGPFLAFTVAISEKNPLNQKPSKNIAKLKEKSQMLKDSAKHELSKTNDPKRKQKYNEIIHNCDKVIKAVDEYFQKIEDEKLMTDITECEAIIEDCEEFMSGNGDLYLDETGSDLFRALMYFYKVPESVIIKKLASIKPNYSLQDLFPYDDTRIDKMEIYKLIPKLKDEKYFNEDHFVCLLRDHLDGYVYYENKIYHIDADNDTCRISSLSEVAKKSEKYSIIGVHNPSKAFIEADKNLGYWTFEECPPQIQTKEFPRK